MSKLSKGILLSGAAILAMGGATGGASAQTVTLKSGHWLPPVHHYTNTAKAWIKTVEAASGGKVKIKLDRSALAKPPGQYDLVKNGVRDLTMGVAGYTPRPLPAVPHGRGALRHLERQGRQPGPA